MNNVLILLLTSILLLVIIIFLSSYIVGLAIPKVIKLLRNSNAIGLENAVPLVKIGLEKKSHMQRMFRMKDHKPNALTALITIGIVKRDEEGKVYLVEEILAKSKWGNM